MDDTILRWTQMLAWGGPLSIGGMIALTYGLRAARTFILKHRQPKTPALPGGQPPVLLLIVDGSQADQLVADIVRLIEANGGKVAETTAFQVNPTTDS